MAAGPIVGQQLSGRNSGLSGHRAGCFTTEHRRPALRNNFLGTTSQPSSRQFGQIGSRQHGHRQVTAMASKGKLVLNLKSIDTIKSLTIWLPACSDFVIQACSQFVSKLVKQSWKVLHILLWLGDFLHANKFYVLYTLLTDISSCTGWKTNGYSCSRLIHRVGMQSCPVNCCRTEWCSMGEHMMIKLKILQSSSR